MIKNCKACPKRSCITLCPDMESQIPEDTFEKDKYVPRVDDVYKMKLKSEDGSDESKRIEHSKGVVPEHLLDSDPSMEQHRMSTIADVQVETAKISRATIYNHVNAVFKDDDKKIKRMFFGFLRCDNSAKIARLIGCSKQNIQKLFVIKIKKIAARITGKDMPRTNSGISTLSFKKHWALWER